jgi:hypothetical protein
MIQAYGLFWDANEVDWSPGYGTPFRMLGRDNKNAKKLRVIDARHQKGIYILYSNHGPHYVGLVRGQTLGVRLGQHLLLDEHKKKWTRFSWFGFRKVQVGKDGHGFCNLGAMAQSVLVDPGTTIKEIEAILIKAMGLSNIKQMKMNGAAEWTQIKLAEQQVYLDKLPH